MKNKIYVSFVAAVLAVILIPMVSFAQGATREVMEVVVVDARDASEPFPPLFDRFSEVYKQYNSAAERTLWLNAIAGPQTGVLIVAIQYPNIAAYAEDSEIVPSSEYQALA